MLLWAKTDNPDKYNEFIRDKVRRSMILKKYPNNNIELGPTIKINEMATCGVWDGQQR